LQESRPYALFTLLTVCSYLLFWHLLSAGKAKTWFSYIVVTALLFYANYFGMFVVFSQFVFTGTLLVPRISESLPEIRKVGLAFVSRLLAAVTAAIALFIPWIVMGIRTNLVYSPLPEHFGFELFLRFLKELSDRSFPLSIVLIAFATLGILKLRSTKSLATSRSFCAGSCFPYRLSSFYSISRTTSLRSGKFSLRRLRYSF